eukprot:gnl/TRDRNA2_/TRDRNA2_143522_c2_seq1.p1 gnl/TRDRNA2_/TRDRNA2_143522_c2~~gnl/TRDRNA2_/TRDRNA2_143522_c2_seq1.p1  ORF type:complete len:129 (+),score=15.36 gnl/TRDRNA2_/TRDRNA2_143522_c2_seq1:134-520(+)
MTELVVDLVTKFYTRRGFELEPYGGLDAMRLKGWNTEPGIEWVDTELLIKLAKCFSPRSIYGVGNAFGFSTLILSVVFHDASVDIIDAGVKGSDNVAGILLTNQIAAEEILNKGLQRFLARRHLHDTA